MLSKCIFWFGFYFYVGNDSNMMNTGCDVNALFLRYPTLVNDVSILFFFLTISSFFTCLWFLSCYFRCLSVCLCVCLSFSVSVSFSLSLVCVFMSAGERERGWKHRKEIVKETKLCFTLFSLN